MYNGKYSVKKNRRLRPWAALALVLVLALSVSGTIAYLITNTDPLENTFTPGKVSCRIDEPGWTNEKSTVKKDVTVTNTGNVSAFIRATIVLNWIDADGEYAPFPVADGQYTLTIGSGWSEKDGYYYWPSAVAANRTTGPLIVSCAQSANIDGYTLCVEVLADAIQAEGVGKDDNNVEKKPVVLAWGIDPTTLD